MIMLSHFWPLLKRVSFFEAEGGSSKHWLEPKTKPPWASLTKLSLSKSLKCTLYIKKLGFFRLIFLNWKYKSKKERAWDRDDHGVTELGWAMMAISKLIMVRSCLWRHTHSKQHHKIKSKSRGSLTFFLACHWDYFF